MPPSNRVRERRLARGVSQLALAERSNLTRQSISAIEAGRASPAVDVALRIAKALDCQVEELFGSPQETSLSAEAVDGASGRVALAHVAGRWVCYSLGRDGIRTAADGVATAARRRRAVVAPLRSATEARDNVVVMGCAAGLGLLADRLNSRSGPGRFVWMPRSSTAALESLARGHTHLAGVHLVDARTGEANVSDVRRIASSEPIALVTLARWTAGLVLRAGDAKRIRGVADLARPGLRLVTREPGSGAQRLFEREVRSAGHSIALVRGASLRVGGHLDVARAIAMGAADTGVATQDVALAFGLGFIPLAEERYDLTLPVAALTDPRLSRLFDVVVSSEFRRELAALGYDPRCAGERAAEIRAA